MAMFTPYERGILKKFYDGGKIESNEELDVLTDWANLGFVSFGFLSGTASLTDFGRRYLNR